MNDRRYFSIRTGKNPLANHLDLPALLRLFRDTYLLFDSKYYFQESFGYNCVDAGPVPGTLGHDTEAQIFRRLRKTNIWPIHENALSYSEDDVFDVIEFLFDNISMPTDGWFHDYSGCGWHYKEFNKTQGQREFRDEINAILRDYEDGYELSADGEILIVPNDGLFDLLKHPLPPTDPRNIDSRVQAAKQKFLRSRSSLDSRRDAVRDLADVLEFLRPELKSVLNTRDENDLFNIANNFGIRHHNADQKIEYDKAIWYSWMFHYYLATIHAALWLIKKSDEHH